MKTISIAFCFNDRYCIYSAAAISSLIKHTSDRYIYDVFIVHYDISEYSQRLLKSINNKSNVNIKFVYFDPKEQFSGKVLYTWAHFSVDVYTRLFIQKIFPNLDKILFLDGDIIITSDIADLFNIDIDNYSVGVCLDTIAYQSLEWLKNFHFGKGHRFAESKTWYNYLREYLSLSDKDIGTFFNAGVILFNLTRARNILDNAPKLLDRSYYYNDQDILNMLFKNDKLIIDSKFNTHSECVSEYIKKHENLPNIIHFNGGPFKPTKSMLRESDIEYWKTISKTDFYYPALEYFINNKLDFLKKGIDGQINQIKSSYHNPGALEDLYYSLRRTDRLHRRRRYLRAIIRLLVDGKKYKKLKRNPGRFFEDSKSAFIRFLGRYYI